MNLKRSFGLSTPARPLATHSLASGSGLNQLDNQQRTYYRRVFLRAANPRLVFNAYGVAGTIPLNEGRTISWGVMDPLQAGETLAEAGDGTAATLTLDTVEATLSDIGKYHQFSGHVETNAPDPVLRTLAERLGIRAARDLDAATRDVLAASTNAYYTSATAGDANITAADIFNAEALADAVAAMEAADVPYITQFLAPNGGAGTVPGDPAYVMFCHAHVVSDIRANADALGFEVVSKYAAGNAILPGEVGKIGNVRIVSAGSAGSFEADAGSGNVDVYHSILVGAESYGVVDLGGRPVQFYAVPASTVNQGNPLGRRGTIGYVGSHAAAILDENGVAVIHSSSSYGANT